MHANVLIYVSYHYNEIRGLELLVRICKQFERSNSSVIRAGSVCSTGLLKSIKTRTTSTPVCITYQVHSSKLSFHFLCGCFYNIHICCMREQEALWQTVEEGTK